MSENILLDRIVSYLDAHYVENAVDFVCDELTDQTQDDPDDPFALLAESVSCRFVSEGEEDSEAQALRKPEKDRLILAGLSQNLKLSEMNALLSGSGFSFSRSDKQDLVVECCVEQGMFDIAQINDLLNQLSLPKIAQAV